MPQNLCQARLLGLPGVAVVKNPPANAGDMGSIPGLGRSPGGRNCNPLQYSCLKNPVDRGLWQDTGGLSKLPSTEMGKFVIKEVLEGCGKIKNSVVRISCLLDN